MKKQLRINQVILGIIIAIAVYVFSGCKKEKADPDPVPPAQPKNGSAIFYSVNLSHDGDSAFVDSVFIGKIRTYIVNKCTDNSGLYFSGKEGSYLFYQKKSNGGIYYKKTFTIKGDSCTVIRTTI